MNFTVLPIEKSPGFIVHRTDMQLGSGLSRAFKRNGYYITPEQWAMLSCLWESEGMNQRELAEKVSKDQPNITRILNLLENSELIKRAPDPSDKRSVRVYLTKHGKDLQHELTPIVIGFLEECFKDIPEDKLKIFIDVHCQISQNIKSL